MKKPLSEMSLEELWALFPVMLKDHNPAYVKWYLSEKENLLACLKDCGVARISHIGSTAVPGLAAKPIVDILLEVHKNCDPAEIKNRLIHAGWLLMASSYQPELRLAFNKGYTPDGFAEKVYHLHVRCSSDWDELYFRDYLLLHKDAADAYGELKKRLWKQYEHNRDGYTEAKTEFVRKYTALARAELGNKYLPER